MDQQGHSEAVEAVLAKAHELISWIQGKLNGIEMKGDHRHRIPGQLFDLAIEHHAGIVALGCSEDLTIKDSQGGCAVIHL